MFQKDPDGRSLIDILDADIAKQRFFALAAPGTHSQIGKDFFGFQVIFIRIQGKGDLVDIIAVEIGTFDQAMDHLVDGLFAGFIYIFPFSFGIRHNGYSGLLVEIVRDEKTVVGFLIKTQIFFLTPVDDFGAFLFA